MNTFERSLFALVSGYVISEMFKLSYSDSIYVACVSGAVPLIPFFITKFKNIFKLR